ncbi:hypothetical protein LI90_2673 [Carbonactinospora thermoautotrophica]|uniref:Uncharacterized protein n=1 Tax=Carbonactinospora thermoautotrophica TaxID=1469144 RepID=A0A132MUW1_9ACTN|nr:hypothetical protein LI90_2673 [Carbonactinospora thermoautotrophica]
MVDRDASRARTGGILGSVQRRFFFFGYGGRPEAPRAGCLIGVAQI